ncbi:hypothetical protein thalar_02172 [Litoreibacter arenae DSM 19593]|uniref:Uncharacterized protein n=1 Tax=Litoreibacter arenae DSM 19593 TaxID=1123360 RepID=S9QHN8_9RHOB|nr:hypothetical protein thalar_02172 [Litoreibacter arenae DSM 19593]
MVATPQCSFPEADIAKGAQHLSGSMTAMRTSALSLPLRECLLWRTESCLDIAWHIEIF